jgi:hypothetical protein
VTETGEIYPTPVALLPSDSVIPMVARMDQTLVHGVSVEVFVQYLLLKPAVHFWLGQGNLASLRHSQPPSSLEAV